MSTPAPLVDPAWQAALAAEYQAIFGYGLLGPQLPAAQQPMARECQAAHEALRDRTSAALVAARLVPGAPLADYPDLYPVPDAAAAARLAIRIEDECCTAWRVLYLRAAETTGTRSALLRNEAQSALSAGAIRATRWRARTSPTRATDPFPGI